MHLHLETDKLALNSVLRRPEQHAKLVDSLVPLSLHPRVARIKRSKWTELRDAAMANNEQLRRKFESTFESLDAEAGKAAAKPRQ
jgi:hypothetical protein